MKLFNSFLLVIMFISFSHFLYGKNGPPSKQNPQPITTTSPPDVKYAVPGTPFFRTVGTKGFAIQCLYPFNRSCILLIKRGIEIGDESPCILQFGTIVPVTGELIEPNTIHLGLYNDLGDLVYHDITNSNKQYSCGDGVFEIIFPDGY